MSDLTERQQHFLKSMRRDGKWHYKTAGWNFGSWRTDEAIARVLVRKGYAFRKADVFYPVPEAEAPWPVQKPALKSPFKRIKVVTVNSCDEECNVFEDDADLYIDPRGDVPFVLILPDYWEGVAKGVKAVRRDGDTGHWYVTGETPSAVRSAFGGIRKLYIDATLDRPKRDVIAVRFHAGGARYIHDGYEMRFLFLRYWLVEEKEFFTQAGPGEPMVIDNGRPHEFVIIDYSPELWARFEEIDSALKLLGSRLEELLKPEDLIARLLATDSIPRLASS